MHSYIAETRKKLAPFLGEQEKTSVAAQTSRDGHRFARRIPKENYRELNKFLPISWL